MVSDSFIRARLTKLRSSALAKSEPSVTETHVNLADSLVVATRSIAKGAALSNHIQNCWPWCLCFVCTLSSPLTSQISLIYVNIKININTTLSN